MIRVSLMVFSLFTLPIILFFSSCKSSEQSISPSIRYAGYALKPVFSKKHGFYEKAFAVKISSDTPGAVIAYTLDCSDPVFSASAVKGNTPVHVTITPDRNPGGVLPVVILRACALKAGIGPSQSVTESYLFLDKIIELSPHEKRPGPFWPPQNKSSDSSQQMDYGLDPDVYTDPRYSSHVKDAFLQLPVLSLVSEFPNFFDHSKGIYMRPQFHGREWERPGSLELIGREGEFQVNAGIRIRGGWSRHLNFLKHAFRLFFRSEYGAGKLKYRLFSDEGADEFDKIDLRTPQNYSWASEDETGVYNTFLRDVFSRDLQRDMGQPYTRSRYYHLFLNGCYWGIYQSQERPEASFAASYFGGKPEDYDVIKVDIGLNWDKYIIEATDGNLSMWRKVFDITGKGLTSDENYFLLEGKDINGNRDPQLKVLVDIDNLIDFMIIIFYTGNFDSPLSKFINDSVPNNFYAIGNRNDPDKGFVFLIHDAEHSLFKDSVYVGDGLYEDRVDIPKGAISFILFNPQHLHYELSKNIKYRVRFSKRVKWHFFKSGTLSDEMNVARLMNRARQIDWAIIAESARWGDGKSNKPKTKDDWQRAVDQIKNDYFPRRRQIVLKQLQNAGLYIP
ncbi:MAG: CotH kinase family protein [Spirochaetales bacterium]|nr:CotH kinase family protein [Spirochaetales bacterium]